LVLFAVNAVLGYRVAIDTADDAYDRLLLASVKAIADRIAVSGGEITVDIPYVALELFESNIKERIFYKVSGPAGQTLTGYDDLPPPPGAQRDRPVFYRAEYRGEMLYMAALRKAIYDPAVGGTVLVQVGETAESRQDLSRRILYDSLVRQGLLVLLAALVLVMGVRFVMRPLIRLRDNIAQRTGSDITPVEQEGIQSEVRPLIAAFNQHTERIEKMISTRVRFVADASHQIRTRLAILRAQMEYGTRVEEMGTVQRVLVEAQELVDETAHFFDQLLVLASAEANAVPGKDLQPVDFAHIAHEVALERVGEARRKDILLEFEGPDHGEPANGSPVLLRELCSNLIGNAIRYTQRGGHVTGRVRVEGGEVVFEVEDNGPGIPVPEREQVFARFYRGSNAEGEGSGLGLAIVAEICRYHEALIELRDAAGGHGLLVRVRLRRAPDAVRASASPEAPRAIVS
jgi:two-component system sensor histidine kinase TctE